MRGKEDLSTIQRVLVNFMDRRDLSAVELAERAKCSLPSVYRRLTKLRELGAEIKETKERRSQKGPTPTMYRLVRFSP